ncbi:MAG TPA: hypothetical protein GX707_02735 [Epulopiscium sp.]|nr:hypothetical protein [Candidatus Epulonipiscium sp.]
MSELVKRDYVNRMQFFQMPKAFFKDPKYVGMKCESKMAYMLMLDLLSLSIKNNWVNQRGEVFVKLSRGKLMDLLNIGGSHDVTIDAPPNMISDIKTDVPSKVIPCLKRPSENKTPVRVMKALVDHELIVCKRVGLTKCNEIYLRGLDESFIV